MGLGRVIFLYVAQSTTNDIPNRSMSGIRVTLKFSTQPCENLGACPWLVHAHTRHLPSKGDNDLSIFYGKGGGGDNSHNFLFMIIHRLRTTQK